MFRTLSSTVYAYVLVSALACALLIVLYFNACRKPASPERVTKVTPIEPSAVAARLEGTMLHAGGSGVWIKGPAAKTAARSNAAGEVLVTSSAFDAVLGAVERESARQALHVRVTASAGIGRWRSVQVETRRGGDVVCRWRVREVPQLRRAAIIIDDLGQDVGAAHKLLQLGYPLTFSILPHLRHSVQIAEDVHRAGREIMLHLPMEPEPGSSARVSPEGLEVGMTAAAVRHTIEADLASVPYAEGVNNHMGSRATADTRLMADVMQVLSERHFYFVDSRTTPGSVALDVARHKQLAAFYRSVFLDDTETTPYTLGQLREFCRVLEEQGTAIAIGHPHPSTIRALAQFLPELERDDIQLLPARQIVLLPEAARLWPPGGSLFHARNAVPGERRDSTRD